MDLKNSMIAWTPIWAEGVSDADAPPGSIAVGPHPDHPGGWSHRYLMTVGACNRGWRNATFQQRRLWLLCEVLTAIIGYGIDPQLIHRTLSP